VEHEADAQYLEKEYSAKKTFIWVFLPPVVCRYNVPVFPKQVTHLSSFWTKIPDASETQKYPTLEKSQNCHKLFISVW